MWCVSLAMDERLMLDRRWTRTIKTGRASWVKLTRPKRCERRLAVSRHCLRSPQSIPSIGFSNICPWTCLRNPAKQACTVVNLIAMQTAYFHQSIAFFRFLQHNKHRHCRRNQYVSFLSLALLGASLRTIILPLVDRQVIVADWYEYRTCRRRLSAELRVPRRTGRWSRLHDQRKHSWLF